MSEHSKRTLGPINLIPCRGDPPLSLRRLPVSLVRLQETGDGQELSLIFPMRWRRWVAFVTDNPTSGWGLMRRRLLWRTHWKTACTESVTKLTCLGAVSNITPYWQCSYYLKTRLFSEWPTLNKQSVFPIQSAQSIPQCIPKSSVQLMTTNQTRYPIMHWMNVDKNVKKKVRGA